MKFFVPGAAPGREEERYQELADWCRRAAPAERRVCGIDWVHNGARWTATVGERLTGAKTRKTRSRGKALERTTPLSDPATVLAIFPGKAYLVVTDARPLKLDLFVQRFNELAATRLIRRDDLRATFNLRMAVDTPLAFSAHAPDEDDLRSFLLTLRQFVSDKEPVFVRRIASILWQRCSGDTVRAELQAARSLFDRSMTQGTLQVIWDRARLRPDEVLDMWINGKYFHSDRRKSELLDQLDPMSTIFVRHVFLEVLVEAAKYIRFLASVIVVGRREGFL